MSRSLLCLVLVSLVMSGSVTSGQTPSATRVFSSPVISGIFPPGACRGTTIEWTLRGRGFSRVKQLIGLAPGVEVVEFAGQSDTEARVVVKVAADAPTGYRELRVDGPDGISNLALVRIDSLAQQVEVEPNDEPGQAIEIAPGTAVAGTLRATDIDHIRIKAKPGQRLTIDLEARRLGTAFSPVVTAMKSSGSSLAQGRERPGGDRDCRFGVTVPEDGLVVLSLRDNIYAGSDLASYRLRVDTAPFASGLFPLGGPRGKLMEVQLSGGTLAAPRLRKIQLPSATNPDFDLGPFEAPEGAVVAPMRFVVGDENEVNEPAGGSTEKPFPITIGQTINGRIDREGEVDRYLLKVKKGERVRLKIQAADLGSWIDSVVSIRKPNTDTLLAENDDEGNAGGAQRVNALGLIEGSQDSLLDYTPTEDGEVLVEVTDRFGAGGPEYAYRLGVGRKGTDFNVTLMLGNPNANVAANPQGLTNTRLAPGLMGVFNLKPGSTTPVNFSLKSEGSPGPITLTVEGLPPGIRVEPIKVDMSSPDGGTRSVADALVFRVDTYAEPGVGMVEVVATSSPKQGERITRLAHATVGVQLSNAGGQALPITRSISRFPVRILGEPRTRLVGPPPPPSLLGVSSPGVLLQGDRIDMELQFDLSPLADPGFEFEAHASGIGLATNTVISSGQTSQESEETPKSDVLIRVLASPKTPPGVYPVSMQAKFSGGRVVTEQLAVVVRAPVEVLVRPETYQIKPGGTAEVWVGIRREPGCDGEVEIKCADLPRGYKLVGTTTLGEGQSEGLLKIEMGATARAIRTPRDLIISAVARMPRGAVTVESAIRPRIVSVSAEE